MFNESADGTMQISNKHISKKKFSSGEIKEINRLSKAKCDEILKNWNKFYNDKEKPTYQKIEKIQESIETNGGSKEKS